MCNNNLYSYTQQSSHLLPPGYPSLSLSLQQIVLSTSAVVPLWTSLISCLFSCVLSRAPAHAASTSARPLSSAEHHLTSSPLTASLPQPSPFTTFNLIHRFSTQRPANTPSEPCVRVQTLSQHHTLTRKSQQI